MSTSHAVIVVGAGFSGIGMAARMKEMGIDDFVVLDRGNDLGGTWRDNAYPGAACDVPSNLYSYSFALNPEWTSSFPSQGEIWDYMRGCEERFEIGDHLRFSLTIDEARFDEGAKEWVVRAKSGETYRAPVLIWATGSLSEPSIPAFPGLEQFEGPVFHSARWDHSIDLRTKRVCVVGTGASTVQFVPQIQPVVGQLCLYQRTPPWVFPRNDKDVSPLRKRLYRRFPLLQRMSRLRIYLTFELLLGVFMGEGEGRKEQVRKRALAHLAEQVPDETLRASLTPDYEVGCKRLLLSDDYYPSLSKPNVEVVNAAVASFTADAVVGDDGVRAPGRRGDHGHGLRGGRAALRRAHCRPRGREIVRGLARRWGRGLRGLDGVGLSQPLLDDRAQRHLGPQLDDLHDRVAHQLHRERPGLFGAPGRVHRRGQASRPAALQRVAPSRAAHSVWVTGGCHSWYLDERGRNTTLWPEHTWRFRKITKRFHPGEYIVAS